MFCIIIVIVVTLQLLTLLFGQFLCRYDNEKGRYRANKKASMLSLLEDGYMDAEDDNEKVTLVTTYTCAVIVHHHISIL